MVESGMYLLVTTETPSPRQSQGPTTSTTDHREAERLASAVLSELAEGIAMLAADRSVVSWSPHAERLTGYTLEQVNGAGRRGPAPADLSAGVAQPGAECEGCDAARRNPHAAGLADRRPDPPRRR